MVPQRSCTASIAALVVYGGTRTIAPPSLAGVTPGAAADTRANSIVQAADYLADEGLMQTLAVAYDAQLFPVDPSAADADFLRVRPLPHMTVHRSFLSVTRTS